MERTLNKSQHTKLTLKKKIFLPLPLGYKLITFLSWARCFTKNYPSSPSHLTFWVKNTQHGCSVCPHKLKHSNRVKHWWILNETFRPSNETFILNKTFKSLKFHIHYCSGGVVASSLHARILGECSTIHSPPALFFLFFLKWWLAHAH